MAVLAALGFVAILALLGAAFYVLLTRPKALPESMIVADGSNPTDLVYIFRSGDGVVEVLIRREGKWHKAQPGFMLIEQDQKKYTDLMTGMQALNELRGNVVHDGRKTK